MFFTLDTKMQFCSIVAKCSKSFAGFYKSRVALKVMHDYVVRIIMGLILIIRKVVVLGPNNNSPPCMKVGRAR